MRHITMPHVLFKGGEFMTEGRKKGGESLLETTLNTRDLGGYRTAAGTCTTFQRMLRSDAPRHINKRDVAYLSDRQITTIIDMREKKVTAAKPSPFVSIPGFFYHPIPIEEGGTIPESVQAVPKSYIDIAKSQNMYSVFHGMAHAPNGVLFHCSAGKDRTGVVSAILLSLAGVSESDIVRDYMITKECNQKRFLLARQNFPDIDIQIIIPREEYMLGFLQLFREIYSSAAAYLQSIGLSADEIHRLSKKLTDG